MGNNEIFKKYKKFMEKRKKVKLIKVKANKIELCSKECNFAIIVPYRNDFKNIRAKQLQKFLHYMPQYLEHLGKNYHFKIFVIEQVTEVKNGKYGERFNRGALLNIGFIEAKKQGFKYFIFHDVDLIPDKKLLNFYGAYPSDPIHIASVNLKYQFEGYFGGVNSFNIKDFERINGYPNNYWGWGGEDDELYDRVAYTEMKHNKPTKNEKTPCKFELRLQHHNWKHNGLNTIKYKVVSKANNNSEDIIKVDILL